MSSREEFEDLELIIGPVKDATIINLPKLGRCQLLNYKDVFKDFNLGKISVIGDGSCYLHAMLKGYSKIYIDRSYQGSPMSRSAMVKDFRLELANKLGEIVNDDKGNRVRRYDLIANGLIKELGETVPEFSFEQFKKDLAGSTYLTPAHSEYISNMFNRNVYMIDSKTEDVYVAGDDSKGSVLFKDKRPSVVLLALHNPEHYELICRFNANGECLTFFDDGDSLIKFIKQRTKEIIALGENRVNNKPPPVITRSFGGNITGEESKVSSGNFCSKTVIVKLK